jgi:hypothetical protein
MELVLTATQHFHLLESLKVFKTHKAFHLIRVVHPGSLLDAFDLFGCETRSIHSAVSLAHLYGLLQEALFLFLVVVHTGHGVEEGTHHQFLLSLGGFLFLLVHGLLNLTDCVLRTFISRFFLVFLTVFQLSDF